MPSISRKLTKICTACGVERGVRWFHYRAKADGRREARCKFCASVAQREWYRQKKRDPAFRAKYAAKSKLYQRAKRAAAREQAAAKAKS